MKRSDAIKVVALMQATWPQRQLSKETITIYTEAIIDLDVDQMLAAVEYLKITEEWLPSISKVRRAALDVVPGSATPDPHDAWAEVREQLRRVGSTRGMLDFSTDMVREPVWSHPAVGQAADAIGWDSLCQSTNEVADRAHFFRVYEATRERSVRERAMTPQGRELIEGLAARLANPQITYELSEGKAHE